MLRIRLNFFFPRLESTTVSSQCAADESISPTKVRFHEQSEGDPSHVHKARCELVCPRPKMLDPRPTLHCYSAWGPKDLDRIYN